MTVTDIAASIHLDGGYDSGRTLTNIRAILRGTLNQAMRWDLAPCNVAALADPPAVAAVNPLAARGRARPYQDQADQPHPAYPGICR